jgi:hypothetical protein
VQDRLELVFGIPSASMFATDRYTFLKKVKFGRKGRVYRVLGYEFESAPEKREFVEVFRFRRGSSIDECSIEAKFIRNPEAEELNFAKVDLSKLEGNLDIDFVPPVLERRSADTGISPDQYIMQAFFKGKLYHKIYKASMELNDKLLREIDFVVRMNTETNRLLSSLEQENGAVDFKEAEKRLDVLFDRVLKQELATRKVEAKARVG